MGPEITMLDKVAVITGGSRGLGKELARRFARGGAVTVIMARNRNELETSRSEIAAEGRPVIAIPCDVSNEEQVESAVKRIYEELGRIDVLINNAAIDQFGYVEEVSTEEFDRVMNSNFRSLFLMTRPVLTRMKERGEGFIVYICSGAGKNGIAGRSIYCASKFALRGFAESVALEAKPANVRVSIMYPGTMNTLFGGKERLENPDAHQHSMEPADVADTVFHMVNQPERYWLFEITARAFFAGRTQ